MKNDDPILQALAEMATPDVYRRNPFHLFSLNVDATLRDIRRRREDIDAAMATGDVKSEVAQSILLSPAPDEHAITDSFARLENPVTRLLDEIFAFWPLPGKTCKQDEFLRRLASGTGGTSAITDVCRAWNTLTQTESSHVAYHNLAVMRHLLALEWEDKDSKGSPDDFQKRKGYWEDAVLLWAVVLDSGFFWDAVQSRAEALNDPRLTPQTVDIIQRELRGVLERICGALFAEHVEHQKLMLAKRQTEYAAGISGGPGAERILRGFFTKAEKKIRLLAEDALKTAKADPSKGAQEAKRILDGSAETLAAAKALLTEGGMEQLRRDMKDFIASSMNQCLIIFGNETKNWKSCLDILRLAYPIAESGAVKKHIQGNIEVVNANIEHDKLVKTCWMCKTSTDLGEPETITVFSPVEYGNWRDKLNSRGHFRIMEIKVPICKVCRAKHDNHITVCTCFVLIGIVIGVSCGAIFGGGGGAIAGGVVAFVACGIIVWIYSWIRNAVTKWTPNSFPRVRELLKEGWSLKDPNSK